MWEAVITRSGRALLFGLILAAPMIAPQPGWCDINAVITQPGGSNGSVQYKRAGAFSGDSNFTYSTATNRLTVPSITAPIVNVTTLVINGATYYYPTTQTGGYFLRTDGAGNLTWASPASFVTSTGVALGVYDGGVQISSPTSNINFSGTQFIVSLQGTTTAAVTLDKSSVTLMGALSATAPLLLSGSTFSINPSSVTMLGPDPTLGGDLSGTVSAAVVGNDSHSHTGSTISGLDISADTNLAAAAPITLTGDTVGIDKSSATLLGPTIEAAELPTDGYADTYVNTTGDLISGQLTVTSSITVSTIGVANAITGRTLTISSNTMLSGATFYAGTVQLSSVTIVGPLSANSSVGTSGQFLKSQGTGAPALWSTVSGVASSLAISTGGVLFSSPTPQIDLNAAQFTPSLSGTTTQIRLDASSVTLRGPNVINLQSTLQTGATLYTSSGTVQVLRASTITTVNDVTVGGDLAVGDDVAITGGLDVAGGSGITASAMSIGGISVCREDGVDCPVAGGAIAITSSLQTGATFYVSSGTALNLYAGQMTTSLPIQESDVGSNVGYGTGVLAAAGIDGTSMAAFGVNALAAASGDFNSAFGGQALDTLTTGNDNTAVGFFAGGSFDRGSDNTYVGYFAGIRDLGDRCVYIGSGAGAATPSKTLTNAIAIGYGANALSSNTMVLGGVGTNGVTVIASTMTVSSATFKTFATTNTYTARGVVDISSSVHLSGSIGTNGQVLTSMGPGGVPTWTTAGGGDALLASTQTWSGQETWNSPQPSSFTYGVYSGSVTTPRLNVSSNTVLQGATFYQSGPVIIGNPNQPVRLSSTTFLAGATFYVGGPVYISSNIIFSPTTAGIRGTTTNDDVSAGMVGEYRSATGAAVNAAATTQFGDIASLVLTAGDWDVAGGVYFVLNGATATNGTFGAISLFSGNTTTDHVNAYNELPGVLPTALGSTVVTIPLFRVSTTGTTVYIKQKWVFSAGTPQGTASIEARRVR